MALINLKDLLTHARKNKYAVGAFNITNLSLVEYLIDAALEERSPIILQVAEVHFRYLNLEEIAPFIISSAKKVNIPVCVHLDHGESLKTIVRAIRSGFTSVMFDGSKYPLEENIKLTKEITRIAHSVGVSVEGEIGYVGGEAIGERAPVAHTPQKELFTKVEEAVRFWQETDVDALAIAIGNVHGFYKGRPELDFERLAQIRDALNIPLVLHGGSGIPDEDFRKAISLGICKINFYTEMSRSAVDRIRQYLSENPEISSFPDVVRKGLEEAKNVVKQRLQVFGSSNVCAPEKTLCITCSKDGCGIEDPRLKPGTKTILYEELVEKISREVISNLLHQKT
ncbi:MAG: class II fructose-bisphosphate aldolase [Actinobacteria bacterium]|nr:class II fructose-bisphosphate aldolase [Actinomycetota bacterium]